MHIEGKPVEETKNQHGKSLLWQALDILPQEDILQYHNVLQCSSMYPYHIRKDVNKYETILW